MKEERVKEKAFLSIFLVLTLLAVGLIALAEKGGVGVPVFIGASPFNTGEIGISSLVELLREKYGSVYVITNLNELDSIRASDKCLFAVISPEIPYTTSDSSRIASYLARCAHPLFLIADENSTSNNLLRTIGAQLEIPTIVTYTPGKGLGVVVYVPEKEEYLPAYPLSVFYVNNTRYSLYLDIASYIIIHGGSYTIFGEYTVDTKKYPSGVIAYSNITFGEQAKEVVAYVLSDGSIFLNQVIDRNETYRSFALALFQSMCGEGGCTIIFDGSRYTPIPLTDLKNNLASITPLYVSFPSLLGMIIANLIHPSTWLPPLIDYSNKVFAEILGNHLVTSILALLFAVLAFVYISRQEVFVSDKPMSEEKLVEVAYAENILEEIEKGKLKLGREDFKSLYEIVDSVMQSVYGLSLRDEELERRLSLLLGDEKARRYLESMNKLYDKAVGLRRTPIVLSWSRVVAKYVRESEEVLLKVGASLLRVEVLEKLARS